MNEALKNQVIENVKYVYLKKLKNNYNGFFGVTWRDILEHILDQYGNIMT